MLIEFLLFGLVYAGCLEIIWWRRLEEIQRKARKECQACIMSSRAPTDLDGGHTLGQLWLKVTPPGITELYIFDKEASGVVGWKKIIEVKGDDANEKKV